MTRSVDISCAAILRAASRPVWIVLASAALHLNASPSLNLQTDMRSQLMVGNSNRNYHPTTTDPALGFAGNLIASLKLAPLLSVFAESDADFLFGISKGDSAVDARTGATSRIPPSERRSHGEYQGAAGIRFDWIGSLVCGYRYLAYYLPARDDDTRLIEDYYGVADTTFINWFYYRRRLRHALYGSYEFDNAFLSVALSSNLFAHQGIIDTVTNNAAYTADSLLGSASDLDRFFHSAALMGGKLPRIGTLIAADGRFVNHIGRASEYDIYDMGMSLSGDANLIDNRFHYKARFSFYLQDYLTDTSRQNNAATGFYQYYYLRDSYTLTNWLMLKGLAVLTLSKDLFKQRYEFALRASFGATESWIDIGGFSSTGGLYPMAGLYLRSVIRPLDRVGIGFMGKSVWNWPGAFTTPSRITQFLKAACNAEISLRILQPWEVYTGGDYTYYDWRAARGFPPRFSFYLGTRAFIP